MKDSGSIGKYFHQFSAGSNEPSLDEWLLCNLSTMQSWRMLCWGCFRWDRWIWALWLIFVTPLKNSQKWWYCQLVIWTVEVGRHKNPHLPFHRNSRFKMSSQLVAMDVNVVYVSMSVAGMDNLGLLYSDLRPRGQSTKWPSNSLISLSSINGSHIMQKRAVVAKAHLQHAFKLSLLRYMSWYFCW